MSNVFDFLTPGSTWRNPAGREVWFLTLTNQSLSAARQVKHPPRVIYFDSKGNVYDRTVDDFFAQYQFHNVDGSVETAIERVFAFREPVIEYAPAHAPEVEQFALPPVEIPELTTEQVPAEAPIRIEGVARVTAPSLAEQELQRLSTEGAPAFSVKNTRIEFEIPQDLAGERELLETACIGYSEQLVLSHGIQQHTLTFVEYDGLTAERLTEIFFSGSTTIDSFAYRVGSEIRPVVTNGWIGVTRGVLGDLPLLYVSMTSGGQQADESGLSAEEDEELRALLVERLSETPLETLDQDAQDLAQADAARAEGFATAEEAQEILERSGEFVEDQDPSSAFDEHHTLSVSVSESQLAASAPTTGYLQTEPVPVVPENATDVVDFGGNSGAVEFAPLDAPTAELVEANTKITAELLADPRVIAALADHKARQQATVIESPVVGSVVVNS